MLDLHQGARPVIPKDVGVVARICELKLALEIYKQILVGCCFDLYTVQNIVISASFSSIATIRDFE